MNIYHRLFNEWKGHTKISFRISFFLCVSTQKFLAWLIFDVSISAKTFSRLGKPFEIFFIWQFFCQRRVCTRNLNHYTKDQLIIINFSAKLQLIRFNRSRALYITIRFYFLIFYISFSGRSFETRKSEISDIRTNRQTLYNFPCSSYLGYLNSDKQKVILTNYGD